MQAFVLGGVLAAVSGGVFVEFLGAWAPASWSTAETFFFFAALVIGGRGSNAGVAWGTVLVFGIILNGVQFLPIFTYTTLAEALQLIVVGVAFIAVVWFRPQGLVPERPERFSGASSERKRLSFLGGRA
jgi:ABC-type branched-subunit amino acid transport system permease subunit